MRRVGWNGGATFYVASLGEPQRYPHPPAPLLSYWFTSLLDTYFAGANGFFEPLFLHVSRLSRGATGWSR